MARKDQQRQDISSLFAGLGLHGAFTNLIDRAIREDWSQTEILQALIHTPQFRNRFPGLIMGGQIAPFLSPLPSAVSASNIGAAIRNYYTLKNTYTQALRGYDFKLTDKLFGTLIRRQVAPAEFATRVQAVEAVRANPGLMDAFNAELKASGRPPLDEVGMLRFAAKLAPKDFYDIYEAAQLRSTVGLNLSADEALAAAKNLGTPGQNTDLSQIIAQVRLLRPDIGPELDRAGITDADLVQLEGGFDPRNLGPQLQSILANRRATGAFVPGYQARRGPAGGVSVYQQEASAAY